jgi:hypothetical protein
VPDLRRAYGRSVPSMWRRVVMATVIVALSSCSDDGEPVTKAELQDWLENGNADGTQADPRCMLDPLWEAGLTDTELRELMEADGTELPSRLDAYVALRDECNATELAEACAAGDRPLIECRGLDHPDR